MSIEIGSKPTPMAHAWPGATGWFVQASARANELVSGPVTVTELTTRGAVPPLTTVATFVGDMTPTGCSPKFSAVVTEMVGAGLAPGTGRSR